MHVAGPSLRGAEKAAPVLADARGRRKSWLGVIQMMERGDSLTNPCGALYVENTLRERKGNTRRTDWDVS